MDDIFTKRLRTEIEALGPFFREEAQNIAREVLKRPPKRSRALAGALADLLRPLSDISPRTDADSSALMARIRALPKADQAVVEDFMMRLHKRLFDAVVAAAPEELREAFEGVRIR